MAEPLALLALAAGRTHGYELTRKVQDFGISEGPVDLGNVYRTMRLMEAEGLVTSEWTTTGGGPARRVYELTDAGWEALRGWGQALRDTREDLDRFLKTLDRSLEEGRKTDV